MLARNNEHENLNLNSYHIICIQIKYIILATIEFNVWQL